VVAGVVERLWVLYTKSALFGYCLKTTFSNKFEKAFSRSAFYVSTKRHNKGPEIFSMSTNWFNPTKAAQVAAFFVGKQGQEIEVLKLIKLIYLADRQNMDTFGHPILNDRLVSMPHGPVNSLTLNYVNGNVQDIGEWENYITPRLNYSVGTTRDFTREQLDELSDAELEVLEKTWLKFGHFTKWQLRDWTHENCPEWEDPQGSASEIPHERVFKFLGKAHAEELAGAIYEERHIEEVFAQIRR
jgi:uncharacterized phage-associated protein